MDTKYNGWTNYETWCVSLWLNNEEPSYRHWNAEAERCWSEAQDSDPGVEPSRKDAATSLLAECLKDEVEAGHALHTPSVYSDLLTSALAEVNWWEIAHSLLDDIATEPVAEPEPTDSEPQQTGNAALVAKLVEALQLLLAIVQTDYQHEPEPDDMPSWAKAIEVAEAAIAAATGSAD